MKYFSDKGTPRMHPGFTTEFADDFFLIEEAYVRTEIAGGPVSQRIIDALAEMTTMGNRDIR